MDNKEILIRAGLRFVRTAAATVLAMAIPTLIVVLGELQLPDGVQGLVSLSLIPLLVAVDKFSREKGLYSKLMGLFLK